MLSQLNHLIYSAFNEVECKLRKVAAKQTWILYCPKQLSWCVFGGNLMLFPAAHTSCLGSGWPTNLNELIPLTSIVEPLSYLYNLHATTTLAA